MKALHLICRRVSGGLNGVTRIEGITYRSCCWVFGETEARSLVGGWLYLHPEGKAQKSEFGGVVQMIEPAKRDNKAIEEGWAFVFEARHEGRGQAWRGRDYSLAWTSGIIDASLPHERQ